MLTFPEVFTFDGVAVFPDDEDPNLYYLLSGRPRVKRYFTSKRTNVGSTSVTFASDSSISHGPVGSGATTWTTP